MNRKKWDNLLRLLFPMRCPVCDRVLPYGEKICADCHREIRYEAEPRCLKCGRSMSREKDPDAAFCADCAAHPHEYDHGYCLAEYHSIARPIYRIKYAGRRESAAWFGEEIVRCLGEELYRMAPQVIVPVPLHKKRYLTRGYNQAEDIARSIARRTGIPVRTDLVERRVNTPPMKRTDRQENRRKNMKNAFQLRSDDVKYERILIVDDIYTSGSTIDAIAREFRRAGVPGIFFVTVAAAHL
ncbi:MAG: ComF family protein [Lachnospiraceae bacterium]|nr:ComF family protein [Lachnospiraceae bacterium]